MLCVFTVLCCFLEYKKNNSFQGFIMRELELCLILVLSLYIDDDLASVWGEKS